MVIREPYPLRDYQLAAVAEAERRNIICVLPTNSGKTVIAAALIERMLRTENAKGGPARKMLFVVTTRELAVQQAHVILQQVPMLKTIDEESACAGDSSWRLGMLIGSGSDEAEPYMRPFSFFQQAQVCVVIEAKLQEALVHGYLQMEDVALLVMDEAHHARGNSVYATIARYFYKPCVSRPRVLALTASPVEAAAATSTSEPEFEGKLAELERDLDAAAWARVVGREHCLHAEPIVLEHAPSPADWIWANETARFAHNAIVDAKPTLAEAVDRGLTRQEATDFLSAWDRCLERAVEVSAPFGAWALDWCARMLERDLSGGAMRLSWYDKAADEDEEQQKSVGGTAAHAYLLSVAQEKLKRQLRTRPKASPEAVAGGKLHVLLEYLHTRAPHKCLVFVQQRVSCSLLADAIKGLLAEHEGWSDAIDCASRPGKVGVSPSGPGSSTYSEGHLKKALHAFRAGLRLLVSTAILEEGIDVPECDAVVDFDGVTSTRQGQQRKGRARAKNASYAYLVSSGRAVEVRQMYENVRLMNEMTVDVIARRAERPSPTVPSAEQATLDIAHECVRTKLPDGSACALLPIERCKMLLYERVYCNKRFALQHGDREKALDFAADGTHFTAKSEGANNFRVTSTRTSTGALAFACELHLPAVLLCSAEIGDQLPTTLPPTDPCGTKKNAIARAALEGVKYLSSIGILDAHLQASAAAPPSLWLATATCSVRSAIACAHVRWLLTHDACARIVRRWSGATRLCNSYARRQEQASDAAARVPTSTTSM